MNIEKNHPLFLVGIGLLLAVLACNAPGQMTPTTIPPTAPQAGEASPTLPPSSTTATPVATDTPVPDVPGPGDCTLNSAWVADVTVPDNTEFPPETAFTKTWRVRNSGTCTWEEGTQLVFVSGEPMSGPAAVDVPQVAAGSNTDVSVDFVAPDTPGTYRSNWQMQSADGVRFGSQIYVQIVVPEEATEEPTIEPTEEPTAEPTGEPTGEPTEEAPPPDLVITNLEVDTGDPRQSVPLHIVATLRNQGDGAAEDFRWAWRVCVHEGCEYTTAPGAFTLEPDEEIIAQMEYTFGGYANYTTEAWVDSGEAIEESDEGNNTRQLEIPVSPAPPTEATVHVVASRSGDLSSGGMSSNIRVGIAPAGNGIRAFMDFDLSELDGLRETSVIQEASLDLSSYSGDCFEFLHPLLVHHVNYGSQRDYPADYSSAPLDTLLSASSASSINSPIDVKAFLQDFVHWNGAAHLQLRMQLDGDDAGNAYACTMEWSGPVLNVTYQP